jgi:glycosyltransferase involved in cell wall biosynthesis
MRILFFIDVFSRGGKERRLTELMKVLKSVKEHEFELVVMDDNIQYSEVLSLDIKIHYLKRKTKKDISVFPGLFGICRNFRPDIIHCWDSMTAVYCIPVCKLLGIKIVNGMVTNAPSKQDVYRKMMQRARLTFPLSDIIIGNSMAGLHAYNAPLKKSIVIYNGFNFNRLNNLSGKDEIKIELDIKTEFIAGMVATYSEKKDYGTYFDAAQKILKKRKDITFLAIGQNTDSEIARSYIKKENFEYFRLTGTKSGIESFINAMDVCILSTFTEGISNSILEYMALGKPVIATNSGGTPEIVKNGETGFLINQSDPDELAEKIELLLNDRNLRESMGENGRKRISKEFSIGAMAENYISAYKNLLDNKQAI